MKKSLLCFIVCQEEIIKVCVDYGIAIKELVENRNKKMFIFTVMKFNYTELFYVMVKQLMY